MSFLSVFDGVLGRTRKLREQAIAHILLVMLAAMLGVLVIGISSYKSFQTRDMVQKRASLKTYFSTQLPRIEDAWNLQGEQLKSRIEFSRIAEIQDIKRWPKLTAYLNSQATFLDFSALIVLNANGEIVYRYGPVAYVMNADALQSGDWLFIDTYSELYRVLRYPLWLGKELQGRLIVLKPLNNAAMRRLSIPDTATMTLWHGRAVSRSQDAEAFPVVSAQQPVVQVGARKYLVEQIAWPGNPSEAVPVLTVYGELQDILPLSQYVLWPLTTIALFALLLWLGFGRWLKTTVARIEALGAAATAYTAQDDLQHIRERIAPALCSNDEIGAVAAAMQGLVETVETREREQQGYLDTLSMLEEAVVELNCDGRIQRVSPGWSKLVRQGDCLGRRIHDFLHPDDGDVLQSLCRTIHSGEKDYVTVRLRLANHHTTQVLSWIECRFIAHRDVSGQVVGIRGVLRDITQAYHQERQITHMALHDSLTGLPNRVLLEDRIKIALRMAERTGRKVAVCFIDLDHFKHINDSLGHKTGDKLLMTFAEMFRRQVRSGDTLARWGGDEFVLLLPDMDSERSIREVAAKINEMLQVPLIVEESELRVTYSMGVAVYPRDSEVIETLFSQADRAMFYAKAQGRNQVCFFHDMTGEGVGRRELYIQNRLAQVIQEGGIRTWFQPVISARSGACVAVEVLARWHDSELGWVPPSTFIAMAENIGLIRELGQQVWLASLDALVVWRKAGLKLRLAVNVSKRQLFMSSFTEQALEQLAQRGIEACNVVLEVTESVALRDVEHATDRLEELKEAGFAISIDDFGTGYSSLSQLHEIRADELKIDMSFVRRLDDPRGLSMVQAIISISRALNFKTVAEGVEDLRTAARLCELGVDCLQGYYFARPMPFDEFQEWLLRHDPDAVLSIIRQPLK